jgi:gluconokinase
MATYPKSPKETAGAMRYFPRMLDKIRLHAGGELGLEYHANMGKPVSADGLCINFLRVNYNELCERVKRGGTDEEILEWCYENGRRLNEGDLTVWNNFMAKFGWNDFATPTLERLKKENGVSDRDDIKTIGEFIDFDEGRRK